MKRYYIRVKTEEQLKAVLDWKRAGVLLLPGDWILTELSNTERQGQIYYCLPEVARESRIRRIEAMVQNCPADAGLLICSLDEAGLLQQMGYQGAVMADAQLYAYNQAAMRFYLDIFPEMQFICSDELTDRELSELGQKQRMIYKIYGHQQLMVTAQCISRNYTDCKEKLLRFRDEKGGSFFARSDCRQCLSLIYHGQGICMLDKLDEIGYESLLLDFTVENQNETNRILELTDAAEQQALKKEDLPGNFIRGHHYLGID